MSQFDAQFWENRIVRYALEDPNDLLANPYNWRIHSQFQQESMEAVLDEIGWWDAVKVNEVTGHILDGHMRVMLAMKHPGQRVPVLYVHLSETEEALALATHDSIPDYAATDKENLRLNLERATANRADTLRLLGQISETNRLFKLDSATGEQVPAGGGTLADMLRPKEPSANPEDGLKTEGPTSIQKVRVPKGARFFTLIFDDPEQEARWVLFLQRLSRDYPDLETNPARLDQFLTEQGVEIGDAD